MNKSVKYNKVKRGITHPRPSVTDQAHLRTAPHLTVKKSTHRDTALKVGGTETHPGIIMPNCLHEHFASLMTEPFVTRLFTVLIWLTIGSKRESATSQSPKWRKQTVFSDTFLFSSTCYLL